MNTRGAVSLVVILAVAVLGVGGLWVAKPAIFGGASKRAATGTAATAAVESAVNAQGAAAAASVVKIAEANTAAPDSPSRSFIGQESTVALSRLPAPDPVALLAAERRRAAVMEGRLEEARALYETAAKQSARLQRERDEAFAARHAADLAFEKAAAAEHARTVQALGVGAIALILAGLFIYSKIYSITPEAIGRVAADVRAGVPAGVAIDTHLAPRLHSRVRTAAKLATEPTDETP